jgi:hypothetical protein
MPEHSAERSFACRRRFSRNTARIDRTRSSARMHQHSSSVAGGALWHTVRAVSNQAVVLEGDPRAERGRVRGAG